MMRSAIALVVVAWFATRAAADDKKQADVHVKQGVVYFKAQQYDDAIAEFKKAYELDKQSKTLFNIANVYYQKGDFQSAVDFFQQYLGVDPDGPFAKQALEFSADAKRALAEQAAQQKAAAAAARVKQAEAFAQTGSWRSAGDEYRGAADVSGEPEYLIAAGDAYRKQPVLDKARDAYRAYLDKVPAGEHSDRVRADLAAVTSEIDKAQAVCAREWRPGRNHSPCP